MRRIYPPGSKQVDQSARQASQKLTEWGRPVRITFLGNDTIVEDRRIEPIPTSFRALFQSLQQLGFESVQIEADASEDDLTAWIDDVVSKNRAPYQGSKIIAGSLNLEKRTAPESVLTRAVTGYLGFLAEAQGILSDLESKKPEGLVRAREVVCTIVSRLAIGRELFEPIRELKNFDDLHLYARPQCLCSLVGPGAGAPGVRRNGQHDRHGRSLPRSRQEGSAQRGSEL